MPFINRNNIATFVTGLRERFGTTIKLEAEATN
jgi:hypothetical protein